MGSDFTNFPDGCHGPVPLETAICSENTATHSMISSSSSHRARSQKLGRVLHSTTCYCSSSNGESGAAVASVMIGGRLILEGGRMLTVDAARVRGAAEKAIARGREAHGLERLLPPEDR
jgi:hypothetical protein